MGIEYPDALCPERPRLVKGAAETQVKYLPELQAERRVQGFLNASEKTGADHAAASVVEQDFFTVDIFYKLSDPVFGFFSEYDAGRGIEIKIKHKTPS